MTQRAHKISVSWFRHTHEDRNDWLRFGLMELSAKKIINYQERELKEITRYGFSEVILNEPDLRHISFILVKKDNRQIKCLIDSEDSFVLFSGLITFVDVYFCAGYNTDVFIRKKLPKFYQWQKKEEIAWYEDELSRKIAKYGEHFFKVKKFIPIAPNLFKEVPISSTKRLLYNIDDKIRKLLARPNNYALIYQTYKRRFQELIHLRQLALTFDITTNDSLWGWPTHRIRLHQALHRLAEQGYQINSSLRYSAPSPHDNSISSNVDPAAFPLTVGHIENYERDLAKSKIGVFACGFHWGWRNILSLALFIGIPVATDRLLTEAYFDMNKFEILETEDEQWSFLSELLISIDVNKWERIKKHNQLVYDTYLHPEKVANYFINQSLE